MHSVGNGFTITANGSPTSGAGYGYHIYLNTPESFTAVDSNVVATDLPSSVSSEACLPVQRDGSCTARDRLSLSDNGFYSSYSALDFLCGCGNSFHPFLSGRG